MSSHPLDIWGTHDNFENRFLSCITHLMEDPKVAADALVITRCNSPDLFT
ncbi:MAG: hypothetical protein OEY09_18675 [Gammaproteobacteria bacterium]|nr:hypothetical protein [Gammaproteobacteria bacterium]